MLSIDALKEYGADVESGLARCMGNEAFYLRMVGLALEDAHFDQLFESIEAGDVKAGFDHAHALKGVLGNLALTPIFDPMDELTEILRAGDEADPDVVEEIKEAFAALKEIGK